MTWCQLWSVICPIPCGIVFGYFCEKIDENDYERIDMVMRCGVAKKLRQQSSKTVQPEAVTW